MALLQRFSLNFRLRKNISIVDQNTTLFDDTIFNNIKYAKPDSSNEEIYKAAEQANEVKNDQ